MFTTFPHYRQLDTMDCGPTCVRIIADFYGKKYSLQHLRERSFTDREGVSAEGIIRCAESIGFDAMAIKIPFRVNHDETPDVFDLPTPFIAHWNQNHFVVVYKMTKNHVWISDPAVGKEKLAVNAFKKDR